MIPFFRKIRKKMANDNKPLKYLRYAIGEIVLVVIGILIALQVNNWNVNRISILSQENSLQKLTSDLNYDITHFKEIDSLYNNDLNEIEFVSEEALSKKNSKLINANQMVAGRGSVLYLKVTKSTYDEMKNTGLLYQLSNQELKTKINAYYELADFLLEKENRDNQNLNNYVLGIKNDDPKKIVMRLNERKNLDYIDWSWLQNPNAPMYREIETQIIWTKAAIESNQQVMTRLSAEARTLIKEIESYLNN
jgi:hypothetical protein